MNNLYVYVVFINSFALDRAGWCGEIDCLFHSDKNKSTINLAGVYCGFRCDKCYDDFQPNHMQNDWSICI